MSPPSRLPRAGSVLTEDELAEAARIALEDAHASHGEAAAAVGLHRTAVSMALNPEKYPTRGHAARRAILRHYAGLEFEGPLYRARRAEAGTPAGE